MRPVFIQSWMIPRKYLRSANLPLAMSRKAAMKISQFLPQKTHSTRNNDAFTHCGIYLISPNTLHRKYSGLKSFMFYFLFHWESGTLFGPVFRRMTQIYYTHIHNIHSQAHSHCTHIHMHAVIIQLCERNILICLKQCANEFLLVANFTNT